MTIGVSQGSCLGPLLFLLYINDLASASKFDTTLCADDTVLLMSDLNPNSFKNEINNELHKVDIWLRKNKLSLNYCKTNYIIYNKQPNKVYDNNFRLTISETLLKKVNFIKYLGVFFDNKLSWDVHINNLCHQIAKTSGMLCRLRSYVPRETLCLLYYSLVYSRVQYRILTWGTVSKSLLHTLEVRLNRFLRITGITSSSIHTPINYLYSSLNT